MTNLKKMGDDAVLEELGRRLGRRRIAMQLTQGQLAEQAGVSKRTVERIEAGSAAQTLSLIRILRVLDFLQGIEQLVPKTGPRPMDLLKLKGKEGSGHHPDAKRARPVMIGLGVMTHDDGGQGKTLGAHDWGGRPRGRPGGGRF